MEAMCRYGPNRVPSKMAESIDLKDELLMLVQEYYPLLKMLAKTKDVGKMLEVVSPAAVLTIVNEMRNSNQSKVRLEAATRLAYMAGYQPVQRSVNIEGSVERMTDAQVDSFLKNHFDRMPKRDRDVLIKLIQAPAGNGKGKVYVPEEIPGEIPGEVPVVPLDIETEEY